MGGPTSMASVPPPEGSQPAAESQPSAAPTPSVAAPENSVGPGAVQPKPDDAPGWSKGDLSDFTSKSGLKDYGIDAHLSAKMQTQTDNVKKIAYIKSLDPAARQKVLSDAGMNQDDIDEAQTALKGELTKQQGQLGEVSEQAGKEATSKEKEAGELEPVAKTLSTVGGLGLVAAGGIAAAPAVTPAVVSAEIAKAYLLFKMADLTTDGAQAVVSKVFPNAGWKTQAAVSLVSGLAGFAAGGKVLGRVPFLKTAMDIPEVSAAVEDTQHTLSEPVGLKEVPQPVAEPTETKTEGVGNNVQALVDQTQKSEQKEPAATPEETKIDPYAAEFFKGSEHTTLSPEEVENGLKFKSAGNSGIGLADEPGNLEIDHKDQMKEFRDVFKKDLKSGDLKIEDDPKEGTFTVTGTPKALLAFKTSTEHGNWGESLPFEPSGLADKKGSPVTDSMKQEIEKANQESAITHARNLGEYLPYASEKTKSVVNGNPEFAGYLEGGSETGLKSARIGGVTAITPSSEEKQVADLQKAKLPVKLVSAMQQGARLAVNAPAAPEGSLELSPVVHDAYEPGTPKSQKIADATDFSTESQQDFEKSHPNLRFEINPKTGGLIAKGSAEDLQKLSDATTTDEDWKAGKAKVPKAPKPTAEQTAQAAKAQIIQNRAKIAGDLGIEENEPAVNKAINRDTRNPLTDEETVTFQNAHEQSINNIIKIANEHVRAMANGEDAKISPLGDLFTHESAKLSYLDRAMGQASASAGEVAQETAKTAAQSSDLLTTIGNQQGTPKVRAAKTAKIMTWKNYADPSNIAVSASLFNPKLWLGKAATDAMWIPYNNFAKGLSHIASLHPLDAFTIWGAGMKGALESVEDAFRYGTKSYTTGERVAERELGMLKAPAAGAGTFGQDYDTHPMQAIEAVQSGFDPSTVAKYKNAAGMTLNAGPRVILAEDQFAKTFAYRAAMRTGAIVKGLADADEKGLGFADRRIFAKMQAESYMNDQPEWLTQQSKNEAYQLTFTSDNKAANAVQKALNQMTISSTKYSPEVHWGRLIGGLFIKTPFNMMKQGLINSPFSLAMRDSAGWSGDFESQRLAATKMALGSSIIASMFLYAGSFHLTGDGPLDPKMAEQRKQMGVPDRSIGFTNMDGKSFYRSYAGLGPVATMLGMAANAAESYHSATDENKGDYLSHAVTAMSRMADHGPLMQQWGHVLEALNSASRGDFKEMEGHLTDAATTGIKPEVLSDISKVLDPTIKDASTGMNRLASENPYTRAKVPLKRDLFGYPQYVVPGHELSEIPPTALETALYLGNPFHTAPIRDPDPVEAEALRVGAKFKDISQMFIGSSGPSGVLSSGNDPHVGVKYHPTDPVENARLHDRLQELAGHIVTNSKGQNMHDAMLAMINSPMYQDKTQYWQADKLEKIRDQFIAFGKRTLLKESDANGWGLRERVKERENQRRIEYRGKPSASIGAP